MGRGSVITSSGLDWERFGVITGGDEVCILPPPILSEKGVGIPTFVHYPTLISMQGHQNQNPFNLRVLDYSAVIWSYMILEKLK